MRTVWSSSATCFPCQILAYWDHRSVSCIGKCWRLRQCPFCHLHAFCYLLIALNNMKLLCMRISLSPSQRSTLGIWWDKLCLRNLLDVSVCDISFLLQFLAKTCHYYIIRAYQISFFLMITTDFFTILFDRYLRNYWRCWKTMPVMVNHTGTMKYKFLFQVSFSNQYGVRRKSIVQVNKSLISAHCTIFSPCLCRW